MAVKTQSQIPIENNIVNDYNCSDKAKEAMQFNPSIHNPWWRFWLRWQEFCRILYLLEYESRMRKLVAWAKRKRLQGVAEHYQNRLVAAETELMRCRWRHRKLVICCEFLHTAYRQIWPDKPPVNKRSQPRRRRTRNRH